MLELFYILIVVVVIPFVCLSKLIELYAKKGEFTVYKFHLNKSLFKKQGEKRVLLVQDKILSLSTHTYTPISSL